MAVGGFGGVKPLLESTSVVPTVTSSCPRSFPLVCLRCKSAGGVHWQSGDTVEWIQAAAGNLGFPAVTTQCLRALGGVFPAGKLLPTAMQCLDALCRVYTTLGHGRWSQVALGKLGFPTMTMEGTKVLHRVFSALGNYSIQCGRDMDGLS